jgi:hypothetical protein
LQKLSTDQLMSMVYGGEAKSEEGCKNYVQRCDEEARIVTPQVKPKRRRRPEAAAPGTEQPPGTAAGAALAEPVETAAAAAPVGDTAGAAPAALVEPTKPKQVPSAYMMFFKHWCKQWKAAHPGVVARQAALAQTMQAEGYTIPQEYVDRSAAAKVVYDREMVVYKAQLTAFTQAGGQPAKKAKK